MNTVADNIANSGSDLLKGIKTLLGDEAPLEDINKPYSGFIFIGPSHRFGSMSIDKKRLQSRLIEKRRWFFDWSRALLRKQSDDVLKQIGEYETTLCDIIEQNHCVSFSTTGGAFRAAKEAIDETLRAISFLYDRAEGSVLLIPDTNSLISSPDFQKWSFDNILEFEILLVPLLLSELDSLKINHRNRKVKQKTQAIIRQIKEYGRRGSLCDGVSIIANRIRLRTIAVEPRIEETLPWLDPTVPDDRLLSSTVEAMRNHSRSIVALVTGDINLQNKASFAGIPFLEPPAPSISAP